MDNKETEQIEATVESILDESQSSGIGIRGFTSGPHRVAFLIWEDEAKISFVGSVGHLFSPWHDKPTKKLLTENLNELLEYYQMLEHKSTIWKNYINNRKFVAELWLFAGHYEFPIVTLDQGIITWQHNIEE